MSKVSLTPLVQEAELDNKSFIGDGKESVTIPVSPSCHMVILETNFGAVIITRNMSRFFFARDGEICSGTATWSDTSLTIKSTWRYALSYRGESVSAGVNLNSNGTSYNYLEL